MNEFSKLKLAFLTGAVLAGAPAFAQDEISELIKSSPADATALTKAYMDPFFKGVGLGLNSGWTNTGSVKKLGRFEFRIGATGALMPTSAQSFDVSKIGLSNNIRYNGTPVSQQNEVIAPTIAGNDSETELAVYSGNTEISRFTLRGINTPIIPAPQLQATVGLIKGFEATVRYVPEVKPGSDYGTLSMIGGGIKFQPVALVSKKLNKALPFDLSLAAGYSQFKYAYSLDIQPEAGAIEKDPSQKKDFSSQKIEAKFSGINVEAIVSKKLLMLTPFVSVGYQTSTTNSGLRGNYPVTTGYTGVYPAGAKTYETFTDPVSIDKKYINNLRASAGFQLNLYVLHLYGSYNIATYNYVNVGVGIGFGR